MNVEGVAPGLFAVYIATSPDKLADAERGMQEELEGLLAEAPSQDELERARRYLIGNFAIDQQRAAVRASHVALDALYGLGPGFDRGYAERIRAVGRDDLLRVARRIVRLDAATVATIRPA
jgi:zinc protease